MDITRKAICQSVLESIHLAKSGHPGGSLSLVEILCAIFDGSFSHDLNNPEWNERDRFVLSKGHGVPALYAVYSQLGYFEANEMKGAVQTGHFLQGHPDRDKFKLMEASTGSLGQGVSVALGLALALRVQFERGDLKRLPRVYCVVGDGEMQEGQVWECLMATGKYQAGNLIFVLDRNMGQIDGGTEEVMPLNPLDEKLRAFNLNVQSVDGHDVSALKKYFSAIEVTPHAKSHFLIANTIKGKGVSFMEHQAKWHGSAPDKDQLSKALIEILGSDSLNSPFGTLVG